ncbi:unnamed protein product [Closterium sp. Naga37s-1]|nr:unnamed protein product [Closterium sp. Naga37s-1]
MTALLSTNEIVATRFKAKVLKIVQRLVRRCGHATHVPSVADGDFSDDEDYSDADEDERSVFGSKSRAAKSASRQDGSKKSAWSNTLSSRCADVALGGAWYGAWDGAWGVAWGVGMGCGMACGMGCGMGCVWHGVWHGVWDGVWHGVWDMGSISQARRALSAPLLKPTRGTLSSGATVAGGGGRTGAGGGGGCTGAGAGGGCTGAGAAGGGSKRHRDGGGEGEGEGEDSGFEYTEDGKMVVPDETEGGEGGKGGRKGGAKKGGGTVLIDYLPCLTSRLLSLLSSPHHPPSPRLCALPFPCSSRVPPPLRAPPFPVPFCPQVAAQMDCGDLTECPGLGQCVDPDKLCDKTANCKDKSDDAAWYCNPLDCSDPDTTVECVGTDYCVKPTQVCDGIMQCPGAIDESPGFCLDYRSSNCNEDQVKCTATAACTKGYMCDGVANCPKIKNASTGVLYAPDEDPKYCAAYSCLDGFQKCSDELQCVLVDAFCDGKKDCLDGSDEDKAKAAADAADAKARQLQADANAAGTEADRLQRVANTAVGATAKAKKDAAKKAGADVATKQAAAAAAKTDANNKEKEYESAKDTADRLREKLKKAISKAQNAGSVKASGAAAERLTSAAERAAMQKQKKQDAMSFAQNQRQVNRVKKSEKASVVLDRARAAKSFWDKSVFKLEGLMNDTLDAEALLNKMSERYDNLTGDISRLNQEIRKFLATGEMEKVQLRQKNVARTKKWLDQTKSDRDEAYQAYLASMTLLEGGEGDVSLRRKTYMRIVKESNILNGKDTTDQINDGSDGSTDGSGDSSGDGSGDSTGGGDGSGDGSGDPWLG